MPQIDIDRIINNFSPGQYNLSGWVIRFDGARRSQTQDGTAVVLLWFEATKNTQTLIYTQNNPVVWVEPIVGTTVQETRDAFVRFLDGLL